jgi:M-phase inducer tyrosine phosphatase
MELFGFPVLNIGPDGLPRISASSFVKLMCGEYDTIFDAIRVIDCRFAYEYRAGHVFGSMNLLRYSQLESLYKCVRSPRTALVFFCEFSSTRAPRWASLFRLHDRDCSVYPELRFPYVYVVAGGFSAVFREAQFLVKGRYRMMSDFERSEREMVKKSQALFLRETEHRSRTQMLNMARPRLMVDPELFYNAKMSCDLQES